VSDEGFKEALGMQLRRIALFALIAFAFVVSACGDAQPPAASAPAENVLRRGNNSEPRSLDPHYIQDQYESNIVGDLMMGLTVDGPDGISIPGAAESWETSEDGLTWTFHLRAHNWSDGTPVTADDFVYAWQRMMVPDTAAPYASLLYIFKNAQAVNTGAMPPEALGARAIDAATLELTLENPAPYLPELMSNFTTYPVPRHVVEEKGSDWTKVGSYVGNGPFALTEWVPNDHITLDKNPGFYDAANVAIERVIYFPTSDTDAALRRFRARELDLMDELPIAQIDWLRARMPEAVRIEPFLGVEYIPINMTHAPFDDVRVREALNLALDRNAITEQILRLGYPPAYAVVPPGTANYPGGSQMAFAGMTMEERIARAQALMAEAGYGPETRLSTSLLVRSTGADARRVPAAIQQMWRAIYVDLEIVPADGAVAGARLQEGDFDLGLSNWVADFNDARNFLFLLMADGSGKNYARYANPDFDALIYASDAERDPARRGALMAEAEALALSDYPWIPVYFLVTRDLVQPYIEGWISNAEDVNRTRWLSFER
jgi:oligopeptide transport system substrate-binding protein